MIHHLIPQVIVQRAHIRRSATLSLVAPGLGHYINGDIGRAILFASADLVVQVAASIVSYILLPPAVQWENLDYLQMPFSTIETRWKSLSFADLLPSAAILLSGSLLSIVIRSFAASDAESVARQKIADGSILFEPLVP